MTQIQRTYYSTDGRPIGTVDVEVPSSRCRRRGAVVVVPSWWCRRCVAVVVWPSSWCEIVCEVPVAPEGWELPPAESLPVDAA